MKLVLAAAFTAFALCGECLAQPAEVVDLPTRAGVKQRMLVLQPDKPAPAVLLLMTGGTGRVGIFDNGSLRNEGNFLVRSRGRFVQQGYAVAVIDTPSDKSNAPFMGGDFRESPEHATDLATVIAWARQRFGKPVWLVGTSRGTQSVAYLATTLTGASAPDGIVLTSSVLVSTPEGRSAARSVQDMPLEKLRMPVLVVHHERDDCRVCPPSLLPALMAKLPPATSRLILEQGGKSEGPACEAFAHHGYNGIEDKVVADIAAWIAAPVGAPR